MKSKNHITSYSNTILQKLQKPTIKITRDESALYWFSNKGYFAYPLLAGVPAVIIPYVVANVRQRKRQYGVFWKKYPIFPGNIEYAPKFAIPLVADSIGYLLFVPYVVNYYIPYVVSCLLPYVDGENITYIAHHQLPMLSISNYPILLQNSLCCPLISTLYCPIQATLCWPIPITLHCPLQVPYIDHYKLPYIDP